MSQKKSPEHSQSAAEAVTARHHTGRPDDGHWPGAVDFRTTEHFAYNEPFSTTELTSALSTLRNVSEGPDLIHNKALKPQFITHAETSPSSCHGGSVSDI